MGSCSIFKFLDLSLHNFSCTYCIALNSSAMIVLLGTEHINDMIIKRISKNLSHIHVLLMQNTYTYFKTTLKTM